jgi:hypothetical protein
MEKDLQSWKESHYLRLKKIPWYSEQPLSPLMRQWDGMLRRVLLQQQAKASAAIVAEKERRGQDADADAATSLLAQMLQDEDPVDPQIHFADARPLVVAQDAFEQAAISLDLADQAAAYAREEEKVEREIQVYKLEAARKAEAQARLAAEMDPPPEDFGKEYLEDEEPLPPPRGLPPSPAGADSLTAAGATSAHRAPGLPPVPDAAGAVNAVRPTLAALPEEENPVPPADLPDIDSGTDVDVTGHIQNMTAELETPADKLFHKTFNAEVAKDKDDDEASTESSNELVDPLVDDRILSMRAKNELSQSPYALKSVREMKMRYFDRPEPPRGPEDVQLISLDELNEMANVWERFNRVPDRAYLFSTAPEEASDRGMAPSVLDDLDQDTLDLMGMRVPGESAFDSVYIDSTRSQPVVEEEMGQSLSRAMDVIESNALADFLNEEQNHEESAEDSSDDVAVAKCGKCDPDAAPWEGDIGTLCATCPRRVAASALHVIMPEIFPEPPSAAVERHRLQLAPRIAYRIFRHLDRINTNDPKAFTVDGYNSLRLEPLIVPEYSLQERDLEDLSAQQAALEQASPQELASLKLRSMWEDYSFVFSTTDELMQMERDWDTQQMSPLPLYEFMHAFDDAQPVMMVDDELPVSDVEHDAIIAAIEDHEAKRPMPPPINEETTDPEDKADQLTFGSVDKPSDPLTDMLLQQVDAAVKRETVIGTPPAGGTLPLFSGEDDDPNAEIRKAIEAARRDPDSQPLPEEATDERLREAVLHDPEMQPREIRMIVRMLQRDPNVREVVEALQNAKTPAERAALEEALERKYADLYPEDKVQKELMDSVQVCVRVAASVSPHRDARAHLCIRPSRWMRPSSRWRSSFRRRLKRCWARTQPTASSCRIWIATAKRWWASSTTRGTRS